MCALKRGGVLEKGTEGIEYGGICDVVGAVGERDDGGLKEIVSEGRRGDVDFIVERVAGGILGESCELFLYVEGVHESGEEEVGRGGLWRLQPRSRRHTRVRHAFLSQCCLVDDGCR